LVRAIRVNYRRRLVAMEKSVKTYEATQRLRLGYDLV